MKCKFKVLVLFMCPGKNYWPENPSRESEHTGWPGVDRDGVWGTLISISASLSLLWMTGVFSVEHKMLCECHFVRCQLPPHFHLTSGQVTWAPTLSGNSNTPAATSLSSASAQPLSDGVSNTHTHTHATWTFPLTGRAVLGRTRAEPGSLLLWKQGYSHEVVRLWFFAVAPIA